MTAYVKMLRIWVTDGLADFRYCGFDPYYIGDWVPESQRPELEKKIKELENSSRYPKIYHIVDKYFPIS